MPSELMRYDSTTIEDGEYLVLELKDGLPWKAGPNVVELPKDPGWTCKNSPFLPSHVILSLSLLILLDCYVNMWSYFNKNGGPLMFTFWDKAQWMRSKWSEFLCQVRSRRVQTLPQTTKRHLFGWISGDQVLFLVLEERHAKTSPHIKLMGNKGMEYG